MRTPRVPALVGAGVLFLAFLVLTAVPMLAADGGDEPRRAVQEQSVEPAGRNGGRYNASSVAGRKDGGEAARGRRTRRHRPSYSSSLYRVGEYALCTAPGRCRGMRLLCPMHCNGPCFYDCDAKCKAHCGF